MSDSENKKSWPIASPSSLEIHITFADNVRENCQIGHISYYYRPVVVELHFCCVMVQWANFDKNFYTGNMGNKVYDYDSFPFSEFFGL
jgi:hypothetical protein